MFTKIVEKEYTEEETFGRLRGYIHPGGNFATWTGSTEDGWVTIILEDSRCGIDNIHKVPSAVAAEWVGTNLAFRTEIEQWEQYGDSV